MPKHERWEAFRKVVRAIRSWSASTRKNGWFTPQELFEAINAIGKGKKVALRTVKSDLATGKYIGIFKHDEEKGRYAWIDYSDDEPLILDSLQEHLKNSPQLVEEERSISIVDFDRIVDIAMVKTGKPKEMIENLVYAFVKKNFEAQLRLFRKNARKLELEEKRARCEQFKKTHS